MKKLKANISLFKIKIFFCLSNLLKKININFKILLLIFE